MILDELKRFDKYNLTLYKLIYQYYKPSWFVIGLISFLIGFVFFVFFLIHLTYIRWFGLLFSIPFFAFLIIYNRKKTLIILKIKYEEAYKLELSKDWNYSDISTIRFEMFSAYVKRIGIADKDKLKTVIEYLNYDSDSIKYNYRFTETSIILIIGAFLSGFVSVSLDKAKDFLYTNRVFLLVGFILIVAAIYFERFVIKEIVLWNRNRNKRLKQIIYYYLVEK